MAGIQNRSDYEGNDMSLKLLGEISLPAHKAKGGFDHAAYCRSNAQMYLAHTANDAVDIIDCVKDRYVDSIGGLKGVAGALVSNENDLVFTSNRGENTIGIFRAGKHQEVRKLDVGVRPNGLAFDPERNLLLVANVGNPDEPATYTLTVLNTRRLTTIATIPVPGRTRWTVFDPVSSRFFINIGKPARIATISAQNPTRIESEFEIPSSVGPHGLDFDASTNRLYCACDSGDLVVLDSRSGKIIRQLPISGPPDVIFLNSYLERLYIAIGDPGTIDVIDTQSLTVRETFKTERGAHTIGFDFDRNKIYAFLPESCRALVCQDFK